MLCVHTVIAMALWCYDVYTQANQKLTKKHMLKEYAGEIESLRSMLQVTLARCAMPVVEALAMFDPMLHPVAVVMIVDAVPNRVNHSAAVCICLLPQISTTAFVVHTQCRDVCETLQSILARSQHHPVCTDAYASGTFVDCVLRHNRHLVRRMVCT